MKKKKNLYIVFDKLPSIEAGGLLTTYIRLAKLLKNDYNVKIISVFQYVETGLFEENDKIVINKNFIMLNFTNFIKYFIKADFKNFALSLKYLFTYFFSIFGNRRKIKKLINDDDIVIVTSPSAAIFMPHNIKFILEVHVDYRFFKGNNVKGRLQSFLMQKPTLTLFRTKNDMNIALKNNMKNVGYIYNFLDNNGIQKVDDIKTNKICFVGRLAPQKNLERMIKNAYKLKQINNDFILDIYGEGNDKEKLLDLINNLKLENNVFLKGFNQDKNIYKNYSCLWLTSVIEGFPLVIVEAKANGIPTISNIWGDGVYECIDDGNDGYISDDDDELVNKTNSLINNKDLLSKMSKNAFKNYKPFSKEIAKKRWLEILENYKDEKIDF